MNCLNGRIKVKFDATHRKIFNVGGIELIRPDEWLHRDEGGKTTWAENTNYLETKPQICTVLASNSKIPISGWRQVIRSLYGVRDSEFGGFSYAGRFYISRLCFLYFPARSGKLKMAKGGTFWRAVDD